MNRNFGYFLILILVVNILGALWLLNTINKSKQQQEEKIASRELQVQKLNDQLQNIQDSLLEASIDTIEKTKDKFFPFAQTVLFKNKLFDIFVLNTRSSEIGLFLDDENGAPLLSFSKLKQLLASRNQELTFAANAGMYQPDFSPQGLFVANGQLRQPIDLSEGNGNFYLKPNGIFSITRGGNAQVIRSEYFKRKPRNLLLATQSGPILVYDGTIHPAFRKGSSNLNIRNGVGVISSDLLVFAISRQEVNFYDFAQLFRDRLKCNNALYLDGVISKMYVPQIGRNELNGQLGPMIAVFKSKAQNQ